MQGSPLFFCDVLKHRFVEEQLGHQPFEAVNLELQLAAPAISIDLAGCVLLSPTIIGRLAMPCLRQMSETVSPLARSRSALRVMAQPRRRSLAFSWVPPGPTYPEIPFRLDQFWGHPGTGSVLRIARWTADGDVILAGPPWQVWRAPSWRKSPRRRRRRPRAQRPWMRRPLRLIRRALPRDPGERQIGDPHGPRSPPKSSEAASQTNGLAIMDHDHSE